CFVFIPSSSPDFRSPSMLFSVAICVITDRQGNSGFELRNLDDGTNSRSKWNRSKAQNRWGEVMTSVRLMAQRWTGTQYFRWTSKLALTAMACGSSRMNCESLRTRTWKEGIIG